MLEFNENGFAYVKSGRYQIYCDADIVWHAVYHFRCFSGNKKIFLPMEAPFKIYAIEACEKHYSSS